MHTKPLISSHLPPSPTIPLRLDHLFHAPVSKMLLKKDFGKVQFIFLLLLLLVLLVLYLRNSWLIQCHEDLPVMVMILVIICARKHAKCFIYDISFDAHSYL